MSSLTAAMGYEGREFPRFRTYEFLCKRAMTNLDRLIEHDECGDTALYPMSPVCLTLYSAFDIFEAATD